MLRRYFAAMVLNDLGNSWNYHFYLEGRQEFVREKVLDEVEVREEVLFVLVQFSVNFLVKNLVDVLVEYYVAELFDERVESLIALEDFVVEGLKFLNFKDLPPDGCEVGGSVLLNNLLMESLF